MERTEADTPPLQSSDEATQEQLQLAIEQGDAYQKALDSMVSKEAHGSEMRAGEYLVGYAVEEAEGMYHWMDGKLHWQDPQDENVHIEPPDFMRHDKKNGLRFREPVEVEFSNVKLETGQKIS